MLSNRGSLLSRHVNKSIVDDGQEVRSYLGNMRHVSSEYELLPPGEPRDNLDPLGEASVKPVIGTVHLLATIVSLACSALAITVIANENLSWYLGPKNYQLIVIGFLLSVMNLCLSSIASTAFLLIEARFGPSTIQNYDGILRNSMLSSRLTITWRIIIFLMRVLPIGLSVAYKSFQGGQSVMSVNASTYIANASYYGMFAPPGIQESGARTGISLFSNATLPFAMVNGPRNGSEPSIPPLPHAFGFNTVLLSNESTALLDAPQPSYIMKVQALLKLGESWNVSASVFATVASLSHLKTTDPNSYKSSFDDDCSHGSAPQSGALTSLTMMENGPALAMLSPFDNADQSKQYIGFGEDPGIIQQSQMSCEQFYDGANLFEINRQLCRGTWSITQGGVQLVEGSCNNTVLDPIKQLPITQNTLFLSVWYMSSLNELISPFSTTRPQSLWERPYMATGMAAMLWSRITRLNSAENIVNDDPLPLTVVQRQDPDGKDVSYEQIGLLYHVDDDVVYIRRTLRRTFLLYAVLVVQPIMTVALLTLTILFYSTPVTSGFGLVSILSGIDTSTIDVLAGAGLSGSLKKRVRLTIDPSSKGSGATVHYRLHRPLSGRVNGRLEKRVVYQ